MPTDTTSIVAIILGPLSIAALIGLAVWWVKNREPPDHKPPGAT